MWRLRIYQRIISKRFLHTNTKEKISKEHHDSFPPPNDPYWGQYYLQRAQQIDGKWAKYTLGALGLATITMFAFAGELKGGVIKHSADVASRSLQDENLMIQTQQLASDIVQTVLNNPKVLNQASQFLSHLVELETTQQALVRLTKSTLNDPYTLAEVTKLSQQLLFNLLQDPATMRQLVQVCTTAILDPATKASVVTLLETLMEDTPTMQNLTRLVSTILVQNNVLNSVSINLNNAGHDLLSNKDILEHSKVFVSDVLQDNTVQSTGGDAIWSTAWYTVTPRWLSSWWTNVKSVKATEFQREDVKENDTISDEPQLSETEIEITEEVRSMYPKTGSAHVEEEDLNEAPDQSP